MTTQTDAPFFADMNECNSVQRTAGNGRATAAPRRAGFPILYSPQAPACNGRPQVGHALRATDRVARHGLRGTDRRYFFPVASAVTSGGFRSSWARRCSDLTD